MPKGVYKRVKRIKMSEVGRANCKAGAVNRRSPTVRAGRRKCSRCKAVWNRPKGSGSKICDRCVMHCPRCDSPRPIARKGYCDPCNAGFLFYCNLDLGDWYDVFDVVR